MMNKINRTYLRNRRTYHLLIMQFIMILVILELPENALAYSYTVEIKCPEYWQVTYPDKVVTFDLKLTNPSGYYDSFSVYIDDPLLPENWTASFYTANRKVKGVGLEPRQTVSLVLQVNVPEDAIPRDYWFTVYANGTYTLASRMLLVTVESPLLVTYQIELYCPVDWQVTYPNNNLTYNFRITNPTPYYENYLVYVDNPSLPENWTANFYVENRNVRSFSAPPLGNSDIVLEIGVPEEASPGDYRFRVQINGNYIDASQGLTVTVERVPSIPRKISLTCPIKSQSILTGQSTYYSIKVMNEGPETENVFLTFDLSTEMKTWDITFSKSDVTISANESVWVTLNVKPPSIIQAGNYSITAKAKTEDGKMETNLETTTQILGFYALEITGVQPVNPQVAQGEKVDVIVVVRNLGQSPVTRLKLNVNSPAIANILVTPLDVIALEPQASVNFQIRIAPNIGLTAGDYTIEVQAESSETKTTTRAFPVSVVSPIPWFWISIGVAVIATALIVIAIQKLISKIGVRVRVSK